MTTLAKIIEIDRRFARSTRVDADLNGTPPLIGYVLQASVAKALNTLAESQIESHQGAFTWTGPYGGGKSSAALLIANLVAGKKENRSIARKIAGEAITSSYRKAFPEKDGAWSVVAVTGSRVRLRDAVADGAASTFGWNSQARLKAGKSDSDLIRSIQQSGSEGGSGTLLILDELGKLLEHEALEGGDVHLLQDIAEQASRSKGRLVVIGILHQSFEQYAAKAARDARQEWAKVQGRFQDIAFLSGADETVALLGRAISSSSRPKDAMDHASAVAHAVAQRRPVQTEILAEALAAAWPLNPVTALLLGPVSRARFAQNERSVFGFLSSAEPAGFQEFLHSTEENAETYGPDRLWDYLVSNFGMALASGNEGSRFSLAFEAIERTAAKGGDLHVALTKSAAIIEFFRNGSGLTVAEEFLAQSVPGADSNQLRSAISDLLDWAVLIRQPRLGGYALFAGSDFDLDEAMGRTIGQIDAGQLEDLPQHVGLGFAVAKRHYFMTGSLRTFEITLQLVSSDLSPEALSQTLLARSIRGSGTLALVLGDGSISQSDIDLLCKKAAKILTKSGRVIALGGAPEAYALRSSAAELLAVERVFRDHPQLEGDRIARREIAARQSHCIDILHRTIEAALQSARWWLAPDPIKSVQEPLPVVASALADVGYPATPILQSELLQRDKPSSNSMAALRELCRAMVAHYDQPNLGMTGYPAEFGLYLTVLKPFGLHRETEHGQLSITGPDESREGASLKPAWEVLDNVGDDQLNAVYEKWASAPFGIKGGVMPVFALAYMLANREKIAIYIDGVFQTRIDDVLIDKLLQKPADFRLRKIDRSVKETAFLSGLAYRFGVDGTASLPVAQALFQRFEALTPYSARTNSVGRNAQIVRKTVLRSTDPEALLFEELPKALDDNLSPELVFEALMECEASYQMLLVELRGALSKALGVDNETFSGITARATVLKNLTNDYAFEAFVDRVAALESKTGDVEGLLSLLLHRPAHSWSDRDREQALTEVARYGRRFRELETLAVVRDRRSQTEAVALIVGLDPQVPPLMRSFALSEKEKTVASGLAERILEVLELEPDGRRLGLAALARAVASLAGEIGEDMEAA